MPLKQASLGTEESHHLVGPSFLGRPAVVDNLCIRENEASMSDFSCPQTKVRLFAIHEKCRIESPQYIPQLLANQKKASANDVYLSYRITPPTSVRFRSEQERAGKYARQPSCGA